MIWKLIIKSTIINGYKISLGGRGDFWREEWREAREKGQLDFGL